MATTEIELTTEQASGSSEQASDSDSSQSQTWNSRFKNSIFRAPAHIRYSRQSDFEPKLVSIGPYYHGRKSLQPMEEIKVRCLEDLLEMNPSLESNDISSFKSFSRPFYNDSNDEPASPLFNEFEKDARSFYKENTSYIGSYEFIRMLVLDSCFIIRVALSVHQTARETMASFLKKPIMGLLDVNIKEVRSDLLLLENQIPLFFIRHVYDWLFSDQSMLPSFMSVLEPFVRLDVPWRVYKLWGDESHLGAHFLDLFWRSCSPDFAHLDESQMSYYDIREQYSMEIHTSDSNLIKVTPNATELHQTAGVTFEKSSDLEELTFSGGKLEMPFLKIDLSMTILLVNLIAFENRKKSKYRMISRYVSLMDALIDSEKDVELLQQSGVIYNTLSSHKMAAAFFNDIGNFCFLNDEEHMFSDLCQNVQTYYKSKWNRRWASLRSNYFSSPWAGIGVLAGTILLFLTIIQTGFTIQAYFHPPSP